MKTAREILMRKLKIAGEYLPPWQQGIIISAMEDYLGQYIQNCLDCGGEMEQMSACCGAPIDDDYLICSACKEHSELAVCETCKGIGKILK